MPPYVRSFDSIKKDNFRFFLVHRTSEGEVVSHVLNALVMRCVDMEARKNATRMGE